MPKKIPMILLCSVAIVVAALFTVTQLMAMAQKKPQSFAKYQALSKSNEIIVAGLRKKYSRNDNGCVKTVEFYNDPAKCAEGDTKNEKCLEILKKKPAEAKFRLAIGMDEKDRPIKNPVIWDEKLVGAGSTKGESDVCGDWRFTVAGSPGWDCDYVAALDRIVCSCIGFYVGLPDYPQYDPPGYCCDLYSCVPTPFH
jgi:hypothetical protein